MEQQAEAQRREMEALVSDAIRILGGHMLDEQKTLPDGRSVHDVFAELTYVANKALDESRTTAPRMTLLP